MKKAMGSCLGAIEGDENMERPGEGEGDGAVKRSSGRPEIVTPVDEDGPGEESVGSERPPLPDIGVSSASSAKASKDMRSAAF